VKDIILAAINAKWIHPSLALRLLKANLGSLEDSCEIFEFALRQPLAEKTEPLLAALAPGDGRLKILGISVSIWNHLAVIELLQELEKSWSASRSFNSRLRVKPAVVLGGPEVSHLPPEAEIFKFADHVIRGEGEMLFRTLCENILQNKNSPVRQPVSSAHNSLDKIKSAYRLYTQEDLAKKLVYVESSRGCPFNCEFCLSSVKDTEHGAVREFPLDPFLAEMDSLVQRGAKTFKFLDRTFNINIKRALQICGFFLEKIEKEKKRLIVHLEMVPSLFTPELIDTLSRFPPGTLRLEIGIQTLNKETAALIGRHTDTEKELETLRCLREKTNAIIHADLIAGLPGEDIESFGSGFDRLWLALSIPENSGPDSPHFAEPPRVEIQPGILKLLPGAPISRHSEKFAMSYNPLPPYEVLQTSSMTSKDIHRLKNFARFWELIINRGLINYRNNVPVFDKFLTLSDSLFAHFGRNWGIDKHELSKVLTENI
jgi:radical SAM superfamily enzyme YgiQ (UPF0313 family)